MHLPRRFLIYPSVIIIIFLLQAGGFFGLEKKYYPRKPLALQESPDTQDELLTGKGGPQEPPLKLTFFPYQIQPGDNLWNIAKRENLDLDTLISTNKLKRANLINVGDTIHIPNQKGIFHKVKKKETISEIAELYKVTVEEILEINAIEDANLLDIDKRLFIPGGKLLAEEKEYILGLGFIKPCRGRISSGYGWRKDPFTRRRSFHRGMDIAAPRGTAIYAARDGRVIFSGWHGGYGRMIKIKHTRGYSTYYGHNSVNLVKRGQYVRQGQLIARVGSSGRSTGSHLHFEIRQWGRPLNPSPLVRRYAHRK